MWWTDPKKPKALRPGSRVAIVSPSWGGAATYPVRYAAGKNTLTEMFQFEVIEMPNSLAAADWIAENPKARADDLMAAFADPSIDGIIAAIGGDDSIRLAPFLDLAILRDNPKVFLGYSDTTSLHFACLKAGIVTFHGPAIMSGFAENSGISQTTEDGFRKIMCASHPAGALPWSIEGWAVESLDWSDPQNQAKPRTRNLSGGPRVLQGKGKVSGRLIGGCAEVLEMVKGTSWWPPLDYWNDAILVYETSEEAPADGIVLRWIRNLGSQGILQRLSGMAVGRPGGAMTADQREAQYRAILKALAEIGLKDLPVLAELDIGHTDPILTLPLGLKAEIDCEAATLSVIETAVVSS